MKHYYFVLAVAVFILPLLVIGQGSKGDFPLQGLVPTNPNGGDSIYKQIGGGGVGDNGSIGKSPAQTFKGSNFSTGKIVAHPKCSPPCSVPDPNHPGRCMPGLAACEVRCRHERPPQYPSDGPPPDYCPFDRQQNPDGSCGECISPEGGGKCNVGRPPRCFIFLGKEYCFGGRSGVLLCLTRNGQRTCRCIPTGPPGFPPNV